MTGSLVVKPQSDTVACNPLEGRHLDARLLARFMSETGMVVSMTQFVCAV